MNNSTLTFLGTGTSRGVPQLGCRCPVCRSTDPRDKRLRSAALLRSGGRLIMIDVGPDFVRIWITWTQSLSRTSTTTT